MAISFSKYVNILSTVAGAPAVSTRELIARVFSINPLLPTETVVQFRGASFVEDVKAYFGAASEEYKRAAFYGSWISKKNRRPQGISFQFWAQAATAPLIYGLKGTYALGDFTGIAAGKFDLTLGAVTHEVTVDLHLDADLAAVAATVQAAIRLAGAGSGAGWTAATVTFDAVRGSFQFVSGLAGAAAIAVVDGAESPAAALGWTAGATLSDGIAAETITDTLTKSVTASNNFGSFCFTRAAALTLQNVEDAAAWNEAQNVSFMFEVPVTAANATAWSAALIATPGTALTLADATAFPGDFPEMDSMCIVAATDYNAKGATQNYMYQLFPGQNPTVSDTTLSNTYDRLRVNYLGVTQEAGNTLAFYQRGTMMGGITSPVDMNIYANEMWFKDAAAAALMNLMIAVPEIPINKTGRGLVNGALQPVIATGVKNGTVSVGKDLTALQIAVVGELTGDDMAWRQVQTIGYWLTIGFESYQTDDNRTEWKVVYALVYSKDDVIRKAEGTHALI